MFRRSGQRAPAQRLTVAIPNPISTFMPRLQRRHHLLFWAALLGGIGALIGLTIATLQTRSVVLEDCFIAGGSLLVPVLYVFYLDMRNQFVDPRWKTLVITFALGAVLGAPLALILESVLPSGTGNVEPAFVTGLIEELAKGVALLWLLLRRNRYLMFEMDGIILGAAAGMGFAALEDMLYGASAFDHGLTQVVTIVWLREILGPFGHGTWTAIMGAMIWRARGTGRRRVLLGALTGYLIAAALHGAWDWEPFNGLVTLVWFLAVGVVGLWILRGLVRQALAQEDAYWKLYGTASPVLPPGETPAG